MKRGWFGPKRFGWGASPVSWEGWLATLVFALAMVGAAVAVGERPYGWMAQIVVLVVYLAVVVLTYRRDARTWL
jgi:hypothetical protein